MTSHELEILDALADSTIILKNTLKPSEWYEQKMIMPQGSAFPGPISYNRTPYWREPVDCSAPDHPARDITIMAPAQMGKSIMVLNPIVGHSIDQDPCNILFLTGHSDLTKKAVGKIDYMLMNTGVASKLGPMVMKAKNNRTGDTTFEKQYGGGIFTAGSITNHNLLRQNDVKKSIADDLDAGQMAKPGTGGTIGKIESRTKAFHDCKRYWVSSPQVAGNSLIEVQYKKSDQRKWFVECPHCGTSENRITLEFRVQVDEKEVAGLVWKLDNLGRVDPKSVGYVCQKCAHFFTDQNKFELLLSGIWIPTAEPLELFHQGYHVNGLYAAPGMTDWWTLAQKWQLCNPKSQPRNESDFQVWKNDFMGELYERPGTSIKASQLMANIRKYKIGTVPEKQSMADGNGRIVLATLVADLGGLMRGYNSPTHDDVRLDWELIGWAESGASYSIDHGSIGTFTPAFMGKKDENRMMWTYDMSKPMNVWKPFQEIMGRKLEVDTGRKPMGIGITAIDTGFAEHHAFNFIDRSNFTVIGFKGDKDHKFTTFGDNTSNWRESPRARLYLLKVSKIKDQLAQRINLKWDKFLPDPNPQPPGFMNFPQPADGKYDPTHYFEHFEAEERREDPKTGNFMWLKKPGNVQNHYWDINGYSMVATEILMENVVKELAKENPTKWKNATWPEFAQWLIAQMEL